MKTMTAFCAGLCIVSGAGLMRAQAPADGPMGPPPVLVIQREYTKPGKGGSLHEKTESAYLQAAAAAKWPTHYLAAGSLSGRPRVLFMLGYANFEAWEKDNHAMAKNATLSAALDKAGIADGELLTDYEQSVWTYDADNSLRAGDVSHSRYFEISQYKIKPGHRAEWMELMKIYKEGYEKATPNTNWAVYESYYGQNNGGLYLAISRMTSLAEDDASMGDGKKFAEAVGPETLKKVRELTAASVEDVQTNLFEFNPKMSYPADEWIKADPFWKPKAAAVKKAAAPATP